MGIWNADTQIMGSTMATAVDAALSIAVKGHDAASARFPYRTILKKGLIPFVSYDFPLACFPAGFLRSIKSPTGGAAHLPVWFSSAGLLAFSGRDMPPLCVSFANGDLDFTLDVDVVESVARKCIENRVRYATNLKKASHLSVFRYTIHLNAIFFRDPMKKVEIFSRILPEEELKILEKSVDLQLAKGMGYGILSREALYVS